VLLKLIANRDQRPYLRLKVSLKTRRQLELEDDEDLEQLELDELEELDELDEELDEQDELEELDEELEELEELDEELDEELELLERRQRPFFMQRATFLLPEQATVIDPGPSHLRFGTVKTKWPR
jgi:hypothetical protein